jgi:diaminopimelate epimerase
MTDLAYDFWKLSGSGNDFICIDARVDRRNIRPDDPDRLKTLVRRLCSRSFGVGGDGVILATVPQIDGVAHVAARFLEADGSECELCGNGTGCFAKFIYTIDGDLPDDDPLKILTPAGIVQAMNSDGDYMRVCVPSPQGHCRDNEITIDGRTFRYDTVMVGVPHLITWVDDIEAIDVVYWGRRLRHHPRFAPQGVNVNFVQVLEPGRLVNRTFEYGVEDETLACGTGSSAAAMMSALRFGWNDRIATGQQPVRVRVRGGDELRISFTLHDQVIDNVCLETVVRPLFRGWLSESLLSPPVATGGAVL